MRIESKLCHVSENKVIVQVTGWNNEQNLGSSLAEGISVEVAEDKAILRLNRRINSKTSHETKQKLDYEDNAKVQFKVQSPNNIKKTEIDINNEPNDWSNELTAIDIEIERLKWSRDDEIIFLEKKLGFNNRNQITKYSDIVKYLNLLKDENMNNKSDLLNENINNLIYESDNILRDLSWDNIQGREYLQKEFNVSTRKELNEEQLISFVAKLKSIRNEYLTH